MPERRRRRFLSTAAGMSALLIMALGLTGAWAEPDIHAPRIDEYERFAGQDQPASGPGIRINSPSELADFFPGITYSGTAAIEDQTADFAYAGTGCTPASYQAAGVAGKIALVDQSESADPSIPSDCMAPTAFAQKIQSAEQAGAIGYIQISTEGEEASGGNAVSASIPAIEVDHTDGIIAVRDFVISGAPVNGTFTVANVLGTDGPVERLSDVPCVDGQAGPFPCDGIDLLSFVPQEEFDGEGVSDLWGWTDPDTGNEYVIVGKTNGVAFFDITQPTEPIYLGELPNPGLTQAIWHDIKVFSNHAFIVSESEQHGMAVFDLTKLRDVADAPAVFDRDATYELASAVHNLEINTETGYAFLLGGNMGLVVTDQCLSGLHMVDINDPLNPTFAGCFLEEGGPGTAARTVDSVTGLPLSAVSQAAYVHDTNCVIYNGPDTDHAGKEVCFNSAETAIVIADVTNKTAPVTLGSTDYPDVAYAHQGWVTDDHRYLIANDELDETDVEEITNTRTLVFDVTDLDNPELAFIHSHETTSIDHNSYPHEGFAYQSNYTTGLQVLDLANIDDGVLETVAFFDTYPASDDPIFSGTWSNYPYFQSGTIPVSGIDEGLFLVTRNDRGIVEEGPTVRRVSGEERIATAVELSQDQFDSADRVVLARADLFPDALAASSLAAEIGGPVLLTDSAGLSDQVGAELQRLGATEVYLAGGTAALSQQVEDDLDEMDVTVTRLAGASRYDTAALVAAEVVTLGGQVDQAIVVRADEFADALAAGALATAGRAPILLTDSDTLHPRTAEALDAVLAGETVFIAGGPAAVSTGTESELAEAYDVTRLSGDERYATGVAIAEEAVRQGAGVSTVFLASGAAFPDALGAVAAGFQAGGVFVLVHPDDLSASTATRDFLDANRSDITEVVVVGGPAAVADSVLSGITALLTDA